MNRIRTAVAAVTAAAVLLGTSSSARANTDSAEAYGGSSCSTTTFVIVPLVTTAGIIALIYFLVIKKDEPKPATNTNTSSPPGNPPPPPPAAPGAMLYLRDLGPEVAQDLATGEGPVVVDFADALSIPKAHRPAFSQAIRAHRARLLDLADPSHLTEARSVAFLSELVSCMHDDQSLAADLAAWTARMDVAYQG